jgi:energy-coupling factor transporter ATP-binding protein EcfA2
MHILVLNSFNIKGIILGSTKLILSAYGPFERLELNLAPITVLIGPNVIGKSFLLRAIYAMLTPCDQGVLDIGVVVSRLCNDSVCNEPICLNRILRRDFKTLEVKLNTWGYKRSLRYNTTASNVELLEADCFPVETVFVPGNRTYLVPYAYFSLERPFPDLNKLIGGYVEKYINIVEKELAGLLEKVPDSIKGQMKELVEKTVEDIIRFEDFKTGFKAFMKIAEMMNNLISTLSKYGVEVRDIVRARYAVEYLNAIIYLYMNPPTSDMVTLLKPLVQHLDPELEIGRIYKIKLRELISEFEKIIVEKLFPEIEYLNIRLPGISEVPSDIPLLPSSILHSYPLIASLVYAERLAQAGIRVILLIEEPEIGLDLRRQRILAEYIVSAVKRAKGTLMVVLSTHSTEMLVSLTKEIAKRRIRKHARVCEVYDGKVRCRPVGKTGKIYVKYIFEELGEIYSDLI